MSTIDVYANYTELDGEPIASIMVDDEGNFSETTATPGEGLERLRQALGELREAGALATKAEDLREENGKQSFVMYDTEVAPGQPGYAWAVKDHLRKKYGFWCEVWEE